MRGWQILLANQMTGKIITYQISGLRILKVNQAARGGNSIDPETTNFERNFKKCTHACH